MPQPAHSLWRFNQSRGHGLWTEMNQDCFHQQDKMVESLFQEISWLARVGNKSVETFLGEADFAALEGRISDSSQGFSCLAAKQELG